MRSLRIASLVVTAALLSSAHSLAQQPEEISLNDLLVSLQANLANYLTNVPSFFCDEHVDSDLDQTGASKMKTLTDSIFRLRRSTNSSGQSTFIESREVKTVNRQKAQGEAIHGPAIFSGAFTNAAATVSLEMLHCYDYRLEPPTHLGKTPALVVAFTTLDEALNDKSCPNPERESGRAYIDPTDFHLLRVEARIPNHEAVNGILTLWTWEIDYAPVTFDAKKFWLPKTIASRADSNDNRTAWSFKAQYSNYHKLTVTSHIITDVGDNPPAPPQ